MVTLVRMKHMDEIHGHVGQDEIARDTETRGLRMCSSLEPTAGRLYESACRKEIALSDSILAAVKIEAHNGVLG